MPADYLIDGILERGAFGLAWGQSAAGKTFVVVDMAASVATQTPWHGRTVRGGPVIYLCGEGHRGVSRRLLAWQIARGISLDKAPLFVSDAAAMLTSAADLARVIEAIDAIAKASGPPVLIIVDTMHRHFQGDENNSADIGRLMQHLDLLREPYGSTLLIVHHSGHSDGERARGSSAIRPTLDAEIKVSRTDRVVTVKSMKSKDAEPFEDLSFELCGVELPWVSSNGMQTTSAVVRPCVAPPAVQPLRGEHQRKAAETLRRLYDEHRQRLANDGRDPDGARVSIEQWRNDADIDRRRWPGVLESLREHGRIRIEHPYVYLQERPD